MSRAFARALCLAAAVAAVCTPLASGRIHDLTISGDSRAVFSIEDFGFEAGGTLEIDVSNFKATGEGPYKIGFFLEEVGSESESIEFVEKLETEVTTSCPVGGEDDGTLINLSDKGTWKSSGQTLTVAEAGMYLVGFARCMPAESDVSFTLNLKMYNPGGNYLSAGDQPLPSMYLIFCIAHCVMLFCWVFYIRKHATKTQTIHRMMAMLLVFKALSLLFESITFFNVKVFGYPVGWNILYYIFAVLKGVMMFVIVLLVGAGWSLLKPFLSDREKKILMVVLILQVIDNIAIIVVGEMSPGSVAFLRWSDILHLVDIICCCAVLMPIVWSIKHLRQASSADGKAADTLNRLKQFRQFYVIVVGYIYFTRIVVYLMSITLGYSLTWIGPFLSELATVAFFASTGYKFRPDSDNPYLRVRGQDDDEEDDEFGLGDEEDGVPASAPPSSGGGAGVEMTQKKAADEDA